MLCPELKLRLFSSQADKDSIKLVCCGFLPRSSVRGALKASGRLQLFEGLLYDEILFAMSSAELRQLAAPTTLWLRHPSEVDYCTVLNRIGPRLRVLPRVLRLHFSLDEASIIDEATE